MAAKRPVERESEASVERSLPHILLLLLEDGQELQDEALHEAAEIDDELDVHALKRLVLAVEVKLGQGFVYVEIE